MNDCAAPAEATTTAAAAPADATTTTAAAAAPADATTTADVNDNDDDDEFDMTDYCQKVANEEEEDEQMMEETRATTTAAPAATYSGKKRGPKLGTKISTNINAQEWYDAVLLYHKLLPKHHFTQTSFLKSAVSGDKFDGSRSQQGTFSQKLKQHAKGKLRPSQMKRIRMGKFEDVEKKLVHYMELRAAKYTQDKCGLGWHMLTVKSLEFAKSCGYTDEEFKGSAGWIARVLVRNGKVGINLHGEAMDMDDDEREAMMAEWRVKFFALIEEHEVEPNCVYNADQTGLYHRKLPNRMYVNASEKNGYAGVKQMKDKDRLTLMVCTSAAGDKCPLSLVGKAQVPRCFNSCPNKEPPMAYTHQSNGYYTRAVTRWWIRTVFWPWHVFHHGEVLCILLLDNCPAHKISKDDYHALLIIFFLPPRVTSRHQPADMGMIASLKVGYKVRMLKILLSIFDVEGGYASAAVARRGVKDGCKGLDLGGKATVLDAMNILISIWNGDNKYATAQSIGRCWRKADILPGPWNADLNNRLGSDTMLTSKKHITKEDCGDLCRLFEAIRVKVALVPDGDKHLRVFDNSFAKEGEMSPEDCTTMAFEWANVENNQVVLDIEVDEELLAMDSIIDINDDSDDDNDADDGVADTEMQSEEHVTFSQAQECLRVLQVYIDRVGIGDDCNKHRFILATRFRAHHIAKPMTTPTLHHYFKKK